MLDCARPEPVEYAACQLENLLRSNAIDYVKWDMNLNMCDVYSGALPPERQVEAAHRYMRGGYALMERITQQFPQVLFEGCAGGGGRYDAGMLAYFPQIWCSDNTDPINRLVIQHGTSFGYPLSALGAHVSASPNEQTGRSTPLGARAVVAMTGAFGYELDPNRLSEEECTAVRAQVADHKRWAALIAGGRYYRLHADEDFTAWQLAAEDAGEALLSLVATRPEGGPRPIHLRLRGLAPDSRYRVDALRYLGCTATSEVRSGPLALREGAVFSGSFLMHAGCTLPQLFGDYPAVQIHLTKI